MKPRLLFIVLISSILVLNAPLYAATQTNTAHQQIIKDCIDDLTLIQNQIFTLAQKVLFSKTSDPSSFSDDFKNINGSINSLNTAMYAYANTLPDDSSQKRDILLALNGLNYIKSSLAELSLLATQTSPPEKLTTLERYFNYRVYGSNTLKLVANLLSTN